MIKFDFDENKAITKLEGVTEKAQFLLDQQVLKDSNFFIPFDSGDLEKSGVIASGGGEVQWSTPYAKRQYYEDNNKSKDSNPNARYKWFEFAKASKLKVWEAIAQNEFN